MKIRSFGFNIIFGIFLTLIALGIAGCKTTEEKKQAKQGAAINFHLEVNADGTPYNAPVPIYRQRPMQVNVQKDAIIDTGYMEKVEVVEVEGGFAMKITFDPTGRKRFENITTAYKGQRLAIMASWTEMRWLAAPKITQRVTDGTFVFTPDCTRDEAERIAKGANNVIKKAKKPFVL